MKAKIQCVCGRVHKVSPGETKQCPCGLGVHLTDERQDGTYFFENTIPDAPFQLPKMQRPRPAFLKWILGGE